MYFCRGRTGSACTIETCLQRTTCTSCTAIHGCGWCETEQKCVAGTGFGPVTTDTTCPAWFFYYCVTIASRINNSDLAVASPFSSHIPVIDCGSRINQAMVYRGESLQVPGSSVWCDRHQRACQNFYRCFDPIDGIHCAGGIDLSACRIFSEDKCPGGLYPLEDHDASPAANITIGDGGYLYPF